MSIKTWLSRPVRLVAMNLISHQCSNTSFRTPLDQIQGRTKNARNKSRQQPLLIQSINVPTTSYSIMTAETFTAVVLCEPSGFSTEKKKRGADALDATSTALTALGALTTGATANIGKAG